MTHERGEQAPELPLRNSKRKAIAATLCFLLANVAAFGGRDAWSPIGPPGSVGFNSAAFDPEDPSAVYLALQQWPLQSANRGGGVAKSVDGGKTWRSVSEGLPPDGVSFVWISPVDRSLLFAASGGGYFRSEDGATSWARLGSPIGMDSCRQAVEWFCSPLSLSSRSAGIVYGADQTGIFKSVDAGRSWKTVSDPNPASPGAQHVEVDPFHEGRLFALNGTEIYRSEDDGRSWAVPSPGIAGGFGAFWIDRNEADVLFATNGRADLFYRSDDGGETWASLSSAGYGGTEVTDFVFPSGPPGSVYAVTLGGVFRSTDRGDSWSPLSVSIHVPDDLYWMAVSPADPRELIVGTSNDMLGSRDSGSTFVRVPRLGLPAGSVANALTIFEGDTSALVAGTDGGAFVGAGDGTVWTPILSGRPDVLSVAVSENTLYASFLALNDRGMVLSGLSILRFSNGVFTDTADIHPFYGSFDTVDAIVVDPTDPSVLYVGSLSAYGPSAGVFRSTDGGFTWSATGLADVEVTALAVDPSSPSSLIAGASDGSIFRSTDAAATWTKSASLSGAVSALLPDPKVPERLFAGTASGVFLSTDAGESWTSFSTGLASSDVHALAIAPAGAIVAGSDLGVFINRLNGQPWERLGSGPSPPQVLSLVYADGGKRLFAGTAGGGVYEYSFTSVSPSLPPKPAIVGRGTDSAARASVPK